MKNKVALITGITGQDGSYLAELLLDKGYVVHGVVRHSADNHHNISNIKNKINLYEVDLNNQSDVRKIISDVMPDECYHLAAVSFVNSPIGEFDILSSNFNPTHFLLSSIRDIKKDCKFYFAGSSEMFGNPDISPQTECCSFYPKNIYGVSKIFSYYMVKYYRENNGIFASTGIMYNHESPRRGDLFVTKKIASSAVKIKFGLQNTLSLGNIDVKRDWGYAPDYAKAMWMILQSKKADDFILATGATHTIRDFLDMAFGYLGLDYKKYVNSDRNLFKPCEDYPLCGNADKIKSVVGWENSKDLRSIVEEMVKAELDKYGTK